jgi:RNA polymerase sigma-70 factor (sigma-E family)
VRAADEEAYREYVVARMDRLRRAAYLLCQDWHLADDLVSVTIDKLYRNWWRARAATSLDAYVQRILTNVWLDETRRPWRREILTERLPEHPARHTEDVDDRLPMVALLATLTPRRRAAVVLRFYCDLSVEETADVLGCSPGTVKSLTARALHSLNRRLTARHAIDGRIG